LKNVRILAIDQTFSDNGKGEQVVVGKTATLELMLEQAEILSLAEALGDISLALRSIKENANMALSEIVPEAAGSLSDNGRQTGSVTMLRYGVSTTVNSRR
jgi:pilus assembly protein CpaB